MGKYFLKLLKEREVLSIREFPPSPDLSYLLGVRYGDGSIYHYQVWNGKGFFQRWVFQLVCKDQDFINAFVESARKVTGRKIQMHRKRMKYYQALVYCKALCLFLNEPLNELTHTIDKYPSEFLRGFFDSEGGVYLEGQQTFRVRAYNSDKPLLEYVAQVLREKFGIVSSIWINVKAGRQCTFGSKIVQTTKNCYVLQVVRKINVKKFMREIGFSIARKKQKWFEVMGEVIV